MNVFVSILGGVVFFGLIIVSVLLHEAGHFIPAKLFGMKATEFFAGFGTTIWSTRRGETTYGFKWLPFGGYTKIIGMYPVDVTHRRSTWLTRVADQARQAESEEITPQDRGRLFCDKPVWQRLVVMSGGILTNLLLAFLLFWGVFGIAGRPAQTTSVAAVNECVLSTSDPSRSCTANDPETPAHRMGLQPGDEVVSFNGVEVTSWEQLSDLIRANTDQPATLVVVRDGQRRTLPTVNTVTNTVRDRLDPTRTVEAGFMGFMPQAVVVHSGPGDTVSEMWQMSKQSLHALVRLPVLTWNVASDVVTGKARDVNSPMSIVGASVVAGDVAANDQLTTGDKVAFGASLLGGLNLFLFWLNVIPLPPMDGGHIAGAIYEWIKRGVFRVLGRPDPGPADTAMMLPVAWVIGGALLVMGIILIIADLVSPVRLF